MSKFVACMLLVWTGMLLGVSFIATPAKFLAENLTLPVALEVGKVTFSVFNKIEWMFFAIIFIAAVLNRPPVSLLLCLAALLAVLSLETWYLLPTLTHRIASMISGQPVPPTMLHSFYVALEVIKCVVLASCGAYLVCRKVNRAT